MRLILTAISIFLIPFLIGPTSVAKAQDGESNVDSTFEYVFGKELRFILSADHASEVERITLLFRPELSSEMYIVNVPFEPGENLSVTHPVNVSMIKLKPYSQVTYSWQIDTDKGSWKVPEQSFAYEDDQFDWKQMTRAGATVHWTENGPSFGHDVLNVVDDALLPLSKVLPLENISPFDIYVYPSSADLRAAVALAGLDSEKISHPDLGVILVTAVNPQSAVSDLGQSIPYELAQLLIYRLAGEEYADFPWWLAEGLGTAFLSRPNPRSSQIVDEAISAEATIPLRHLCKAPVEEGDSAVLARAQSLSMVEYIRTTYGDQRLSDLVRSYSQGIECQSGVQHTLGLTLDQLEAEWLDSHLSPSLPTRLTNDFGLWILIILAGFGFSLILIRYSTRG